MFAEKKNYTRKNRPVLGLKHREDDDASVTTKHCGVDVGSVYSNNTIKQLCCYHRISYYQ